jgi:hypothetical protein
MIVVCDMGPLHYLVLMGVEHVLPRLFTRVLTPPDVSQKLEHLQTQTNFYFGDKVRAVIADMKQRGLHRKQARESAVPTPENDEKKEAGE